MNIPVTFISLLFKRFFRSPSFGKDITLQIILGVIAIIVLGYLVVLGFSIEKLIINTLKQKDPIKLLNGLLIYYFIGEFTLRYLIQQLPALDIQPFYHLPIQRSKSINFLLSISILHVINICVFLLYSPFAFSVIKQEYGVQQAWIWLLSLWLISLILHFAIILIKRTFIQDGWESFFLIIAFCLLAAADYLDWLNLSTLAAEFFSSALQGYYTIGTLFLVLILLYAISFHTILKNLHYDDFKLRENKIFNSINYSFFQKFGLIGTWMSLELKMIFRNKRTKEVFFMSTMFFFRN